MTIFTANEGNISPGLKVCGQTEDFEIVNGESQLTPRRDLPPRIRAKWGKMMAHRDRSDSMLMWMDATMEVTNPNFISEARKMLGYNDVLVHKHPWHNTIAGEVNEARKPIAYTRTRYGREPLEQQRDYYLSQMNEIGCWACGFIMRRNNDNVNSAFEDWFLECIQWSSNDQISFPYIVWKYGLKVTTIDTDIYQSPWFKIHSHRKMQ